MKTKKSVIIIAVASLLFAGGLVACKHGHHSCGFDEFDLDAAVNRIASKLDLTEAQKADLDRMAREIADKAKTMHVDHETRHQEFAALVRQESIDKATVDQLVTDKIQKATEMAEFVTERLIAFHATLTPDQRETVAARIEKHSSGGCRFGFR